MGVFYYDLVGATKSRKNISFQEIHNYLASGIPGGNKLNTFGKLVSGSEDTIVFSTRGWIYFSYEV
jgi:hypothetical protein